MSEDIIDQICDIQKVDVFLEKLRDYIRDLDQSYQAESIFVGELLNAVITDASFVNTKEIKTCCVSSLLELIGWASESIKVLEYIDTGKYPEEVNANDKPTA